MNDHALNLCSTRATSRIAGTFLGLDAIKFLYVVVALIIGLWTCFKLNTDCRLPIGLALPIGLTPAVLCFGILKFLQDKPRSHGRDLIEQFWNRGDAAPTVDEGAPFVLTPIPDGHLAADLILLNGPRSGGVVSKGFWINLLPLHNASNAQRNQYSESLRQLFRFLPANYRLQVIWYSDSDYRAVLESYQTVTKVTANPVSRSLRDSHHRRAVEQMTRRILRRERVAIVLGRTLEDLPAIPLTRDRAEQTYKARLHQLQSEFSDLEKQLQSFFGPQGGKVTAMNDQDHLHLFERKLNPSLLEPAWRGQPRNAQGNDRLLDSVWHSAIKGEDNRGFHLDENHHGVLTLKSLPEKTYPTIMHRLTQLPLADYEITVHVKKLDPARIIKQEQSAADRLFNQLQEKPDEKLQVGMEASRARIRHLAEGTIVPLEFELIIVARARTQEALSEKMLALKSTVNGLAGALAQDLTLAASARNAFLRTLPGVLFSKHEGIVHYGEDSFVSHLLPISSSFLGDIEGAEAIYHGAHGSLVGIKGFSGNGSALTPLHQAVLGTTGAGKSKFLSDWFQQSAPYYSTTVIIEEGLSHADYTRSYGVEPIQFRLDGSQTINCFDTHSQPMSPFQRATIAALIARMAGVPKDEDLARQRAALIAKKVTQLCRDHADDYLQRQSEEQYLRLARQACALDSWSRARGLGFAEAFSEYCTWRALPENHTTESSITPETVHDFVSRHPDALRDLIFAFLPADEHLTLSSFREYLELSTEGSEAEECSRVATLLQPWCRGGNYGDLWDGPSNVSLDGPVIHFELGLIPEAAKEAKELAGFLIINDVRQYLLSRPRAERKRILIEEASRFLDVPGGEQILRELFEQFRKFSVQATVVFQQYSRIAQTQIRTAIIGNCRSFIIFNPGDRRDLDLLAQDIGLSKVAQDTILAYPRPDELTGTKYSEFCYFRIDPTQPLCGTVRFFYAPKN